MFFDIDGTLVDDDGSIPASTIQAIASAQKAGHLTFINTGRTWGNVDPELRAIGFDGFICGCGTEIIYRNQVLFHQQVKPELCASIRNLSAPATQHRSMNAVTRCSMTQLCQNIQHSAT